MTPRSIELLHVEDDVMQQRLVAQHLAQMPQYIFKITGVETEDAAVAAVEQGTVDFVLLDYQLAAGNGLSCLRRIRLLDSILPVVALSGVASDEVFADLLEGGAADCIHKEALTTEGLAAALHGALVVSDAWRHRAPAAEIPLPPAATANFAALVQLFVDQLPPQYITQLDEFEAAAKHLTISQIKQLFNNAQQQLQATRTTPADLHRHLRPLMLEILLRIFGTVAEPK